MISFRNTLHDRKGAVPKENFLLLLFSAPLAFMFLPKESALPGVYLQHPGMGILKRRPHSYVKHILQVQSRLFLHLQIPSLIAQCPLKRKQWLNSTLVCSSTFPFHTPVNSPHVMGRRSSPAPLELFLNPGD